MPLQWTTAEVFALPKDGKDLADPLNYRPNSLTSNVGKTVEPLVNHRLNHYLEINNLISFCQSGFRKNHSTLDHLVRLQTEINIALKKLQKVLVIFVDFEKAYDMVWRQELLFKMYNPRIKGHMYNFILNKLNVI